MWFFCNKLWHKEHEVAPAVGTAIVAQCCRVLTPTLPTHEEDDPPTGLPAGQHICTMCDHGEEQGEIA